jgi:hypothetical protein
MQLTSAPTGASVTVGTVIPAIHDLAISIRQANAARAAQPRSQGLVRKRPMFREMNSRIPPLYQCKEVQQALMAD